jgi:hypothetical protein
MLKTSYRLIPKHHQPFLERGVIIIKNYQVDIVICNYLNRSRCTFNEIGAGNFFPGVLLPAEKFALPGK